MISKDSEPNRRTFQIINNLVNLQKAKSIPAGDSPKLKFSWTDSTPRCRWNPVCLIALITSAFKQRKVHSQMFEHFLLMFLVDLNDKKTSSRTCYRQHNLPQAVRLPHWHTSGIFYWGGTYACRMEWDWLFWLLPFCFSVGLNLQIIGSEGYIKASNQLLTGQPIFPFQSERATELANCFCNTRAIIGSSLINKRILKYTWPHFGILILP